jgi:hypothetical protein
MLILVLKFLGRERCCLSIIAEVSFVYKQRLKSKHFKCWVFGLGNFPEVIPNYQNGKFHPDLSL